VAITPPPTTFKVLLLRVTVADDSTPSTTTPAEPASAVGGVGVFVLGESRINGATLDVGVSFTIGVATGAGAFF
jgi:hypothetical protein